MKLDEMILEATKQDLSGTDADSILAIARQKQSVTHTFSGWKKAILIAAAVCLLVGTVSAAALLSGFGNAFSRPVDTGNVEILSATSTNNKVKWNITEAWFDEYNLHIGGTVVTPEKLDPNREYQAYCMFRGGGIEEYRFLVVEIFPNGGKESAFVMSSGTIGYGDGKFSRTGYTEDKITLELKIYAFHDPSLLPEGSWSGWLTDYEVFHGEWIYTAALTSNDSHTIRIEGEYKSLAEDTSEAVVRSVVLNPFTLAIEGENLEFIYTTIYGDYYRPLHIWVKMKDGTYLDKGLGNFVHTGNRVEYKACTPESIICCFEQPVDLTEVESILMYCNWCEFGNRDLSFMEGSGYVVYPHVTAPNKCEGWLPVIEIPVS